MSTSIYSVMNTAKLGLLAQQMAIEVTGQNIANVQTEGYSRQELSLEATSPRATGQGILGTGVKVASIKRAHDDYIYAQITDQETQLSASSARKDAFDQLEVTLSQNNGHDLNSDLSQFFQSMQDLSSNPPGLAERSTVLARGASLAQNLNQTGRKLDLQQQNLNQNLDTEVNDVNSMITQIADLNSKIHASESGAQTANDLRDKRDTLIKNLSKKIDVNIMGEVNGQISLTFKDGKPLVLGGTAMSLALKVNGDNFGYKDIMLKDLAGNTTNITSSIQGGKIRGMLDMRDTEIAQVKDKLDRLTAGFVREFNRVHQAGQGLDGKTGRNFFNPMSATVRAITANTGSAAVAVSNASPATASVDKYEFTFTAANTVSLKNLTSGLASGTYTFAAGAAFNVAGGLAVTIAGSGAVGDRFRFSLSENAMISTAVSGQILNDPRRIAAGKTSPTDGGNALDLASLQGARNFDGVSMTAAGSGSFTFDDTYNSIVATMGVASQSAQSNYGQQQGILTLLVNRRESADGVSIDEELINIVKFQQAYNASARVLTTVSDMMNALLGAIR